MNSGYESGLDMDMRDLGYFEVAAELEHMGKAAARLHRSQPAITKCIRRLESEIGARLFDNTTRRVQLTAEGRALLRRARELRLEMESLKQEISDISGGTTGTVRLGVSSTAAEYLLPELTEALLTEAPGVTMEVSVRMAEELCAGLRNRAYDLVLCPPAADASRDLMVAPIIADPVVVVAAKSHPLHAVHRVGLRSLAKCRWLLPARDSMNRLWLTQVFRRAGLPPPNVQIELDSIVSTPRLIARTRLLSFISRHQLSAQRFDKVLKEIHLPATTMPRQLSVLWRKNGYLPAAAQRVKALSERLGRLHVRAPQPVPSSSR